MIRTPADATTCCRPLAGAAAPAPSTACIGGARGGALLVVGALALLATAAGGRAAAAAEVPARDEARPAAADVRDGRLLMAQYQCGRCHVIPGVAAARGRLAAPLDAFGARSYIAGRLPNDASTLARWIVDPPALVPGTAMPKLGVSADDARRMAAYLGTLR